MASLIFILLLAQSRILQPPAPGVKTDDRIAKLQKQPASGANQCLLAKAYIQKMRETVDFGYLDRASKLVDNVLIHDPANYEAIRLRSEISMERHEFQSVADYSAAVVKLAPNDPWSWGMLGDAFMELAKYEQAKDAYMKMLALKPDISSYNRLAYYQFVTGSADAAIRLMRNAIESGAESPENTAWCLVDLGGMLFKTGNIEDARQAYEQALVEFAGYYPAFAGLGKVAAAKEKWDLAIENYRKAQAAVPMPEYASALNEIYLHLNKPDEAKKQRDLIDVIEKMGRAGGEKTNRNLAMLYADEDRNLDRARELVENEIKVRPDVYTHDALSWVLFKLKRYDEAETASQFAISLNTSEPVFYFHAGMIAAQLGRKDDARKYLLRAIALNPHFDIDAVATTRTTLATLPSVQ
jgi:tetratricopeptide (TPR) repeat protein